MQINNRSPGFSRFAHILRQNATEYTELECATTALLWSLWLLVVWPLYGASQHHPAYAALVAVMPEQAWALLMAAVGLLQMFVLMKQWRRSRRVMSGVASCVWAFIAFRFAIAEITLTAIVIYAVLSASQVWVYIRLAKERQVPIERSG